MHLTQRSSLHHCVPSLEWLLPAAAAAADALLFSGHVQALCHLPPAAPDCACRLLGMCTVLLAVRVPQAPPAPCGCCLLLLLLLLLTVGAARRFTCSASSSLRKLWYMKARGFHDTTSILQNTPQQATPLRQRCATLLLSELVGDGQDPCLLQYCTMADSAPVLPHHLCLPPAAACNTRHACVLAH